MNKKDIIITRKEITLTDDEKKKILSFCQRTPFDIPEANPVKRISKKTELKNYDVLIIEYIYYDAEGFEHKTMLGLVDVNVDEKTKELTGIRVLRYCGMYMFEQITLYLDNFNIKWEAYGHKEDSCDKCY